MYLENILSVSALRQDILIQDIFTGKHFLRKQCIRIPFLSV